MTGGQVYGAGDSVTLVQVGGAGATLSRVTEYIEESPQTVDVTEEPPRDIATRLDATVDCVVTEDGFTSTNCLEVVESVRAEYPEVPVILITEEASPDTVTAAFDAGITAHLSAETLRESPVKLSHRLFSAVERYRRQRVTRTQEQVTELLSRIDQRLIHADSREEIERAVCEEISDTDPYTFAWVGTALEDDVIRPRASAGVDDGYLEEITIRADDSAQGQGPAGRALQTDEVVVSGDVRTDASFDPWAEAAIERGYESVAAVPLRYVDDTFGVLVVYANRPHAFDGHEQSLLERLGTDISRAMYEAVLQEELWEFRQMVEHAAEAMFLTDEQGRLDYVNPAFEELANRDRTDIDGERLEDIDINVGSTERARELVESMADGTGWEGQLQLERPEMETRTVELTARPLANGATEEYVGIGRDVTEQQTYQDRIETQRNRLELLNQIVRHDIRNDVQVLLSMTGLLQQHIDEEGAEYLDRITEKCKHIADLTQSAREITGSITDAGVESTDWMDLDSVLAEEVADIRRFDGTAVSRDDLPTEPTVRGDEMLHSVFRNLLQNAVKHSGQTDVEIEVTTEVTDETVTVRIADDGPGISEDQKETIFEYMEKGTASSGSGIGLFLVEMLVDHYGGDISVEDNEPSGTAFVVELERQ